MLKYICFLCCSQHKSITLIVWHLKIYHNLNKHSIFHCKQSSCSRELIGLKKFRQHLLRHHSSSCTVTDQSSDQNSCSLESDTQLKINVNIPYNDVANLKLSSANQHRSTQSINYETLEESILLNELVNILPTSNFGDEQQSIYSIKIKKCVLNFIAKLLMKPNVTSSLLQDIIEGVIDIFSSGIVSDLQDLVMPIIRNCNTSKSSEIGDMFYLLENAFADVKTEYLRTKFFLKNNLFFKPETIVVGHVKEKKTVNNVDTVAMVPVQCHLLSMRLNLKYFLQLPGVYHTITKHINESSNNTDILSSFLNGSTWQKMKKNFKEKTVFPIFLYYDDAEMGNPLGSHSGVHKMGCVYYTIAGLPPEYLSSLDNIFTAYLFHSDDRGREFSNDQIFSSLVKEIINLQENGVTINIDSNDITVYFALGLVLGDNLGLNSILGFVSCFSANHYCRICRLYKDDTKKMCHESELSIRNVQNYELDLAVHNVSLTGVNEPCIFNKIPNFHVTDNIVCDFMHDIPEGVARYDMALIISGLIEQNCFSLAELNNRILMFNYGVTEKKNTPPLIRDSDIKKGCIIMSASEMLCLARYFSLIVGELVPYDSIYWKLYLTLHQIIDLCCTTNIQRDSDVLLNSLVAEHNRLFLVLSKSNLKPKYHIMTHYGRILKKNGPIILTSSIRFEAKHKVLKAIANAIPCRINLGYTLAYKLQLQMVARFLSSLSLDVQDLKLGLGKDVHPYTEFPHDLVDKLPEEFKTDCFSFSWLEYKGIYYRKHILLVLENNLDGLIFGEVVFIFVGKSKIPFFLFNPVYTVGFDSHFHAFEVVIDSSNSINYSKLTGCYVNELYDITPTVPRILGNSKTYATIRYAL